MIAYLGIGSNIDAENNIFLAKKAIVECFEVAEFSAIYESAAVGFKGDNFHNLVARVATNLSLNELLAQLKSLEQSLGRQRSAERFSSRSIDIDILLFGELVCEQPIQLPREEIRHNAYVLWPLAELSPELIEPGGTRTYGQLWRQFDKSSQQIKKISARKG